MDLNQSFRFTKAEVYKLKPLPMYEPFMDATNLRLTTHVENLQFIKLYDEDGTVGVGSVSSLFIDKFLPVLLSGKRFTHDELYHQFFWEFRVGGFSNAPYGTLGGLDQLLLDIMSKRVGLPMHRFLGADRDWVHAYASGHATFKEGAELEKEVLEWKSEGYTFYKMKCGTNFGTEVERDVERVKLVRDLIGKEAKLAVDVNQVWNSADEAMRFFDKIEQYDICWYEEPVNSLEFKQMEALSLMCPAKIAAGESLKNHYLFEIYADSGVGVLQANPPMMGWKDWTAVRDLATRRGLEFSSNGNAATTYLATCSENCYQEYLKPRRKPVLDIMKKRPIDKGGKFYLPTEPGLCLEPDWELLDERGLIQSISFFYSSK